MKLFEKLIQKRGQMCFYWNISTRKKWCKSKARICL